MNRSLRVLAAYEVVSGVIALASTVGISPLPGGGAVTFNVLAAALGLASIAAGVALWNGWRRSLGGSLLLQGVQLFQLQVGHLMIGVMIGREVLAGFQGGEANLFATAGLIAGFLWSPDRLPTLISVNLLALVVFLWLWQYRSSARPAPANESLQLIREPG